MTSATASSSAASGRDRQKGRISRPRGPWLSAMTSWLSACTSNTASRRRSAATAAPELVGGQMAEVRIARVGEEALEAPHPCRGQVGELTEIVGDHAAPERDIDLAVALGRCLFAPQRVDAWWSPESLSSGMSTSVVMPAAAAAAVAVAKPSQSVPGSLMCTWVSTKPGSSTAVPASTNLFSAPDSPRRSGRPPRITPSATATAAGRSSPSISDPFGTDAPDPLVPNRVVEVLRQLRPHVRIVAGDQRIALLCGQPLEPADRLDRLLGLARR